MAIKKNVSVKPVYNIKSVSESTGIPPVTLRAWERRYGFPSPERTDSGYRLYSEFDIAALNWLKLQTKTGLSISQAIKLFRGLPDIGENPAGHTIIEASLEPITEQKSVEQIQKEFIAALLNLDDSRANLIIKTAMSFYPMEMILLEIISPTMIKIGDLWHAGEIGVAAEHFATHNCRNHLINAIEATRDIAKNGSIVAACAPGEWHELGLLIVTIFLRFRGWAVTYLGANLSLDRLSETLEKLQPQILLFSATTSNAGENLKGLYDVLEQLPDPKPIIGLGGQAFAENPTLTNRLPGTYVGPTAEEAVDQIERMLKSF